MSIALLLTLSLNSCAQRTGEPAVPPAVKAAFAQQFPQAEHPQWELEDGKDLEVEFKQAGTEWSAKYDGTAKWLETEHGIADSALPEAVRNAIATEYPAHKVKECEMAETPAGTNYEVELREGAQTLEVAFTAEGKVLASKEEKADANDEED